MSHRYRRALLALATLAATLTGTLAVAQPAQARSLSYCYTNSICAYASTTPWPIGNPPPGGLNFPIERDAADTPRNTCFTGFGTTSTFTVINNSQYRWYLFRTTDCGGSHIEVPPFTEMHTPSGWDKIHAWMRTSSLT